MSKSATADEIKKAFRDKAKIYHPDVSKLPDAHEQFVKIGEAYATLKDPKTRADYDRHLAMGGSSRSQSYSRPSPGAQQTGYQYDYGEAQRRARAEAENYASISLDELFEAIFGLALDAGRTFLLGDRTQPHITIFSYLKAGFFGFILTLCLMLTFTGIGTLPGLFFGFITLRHALRRENFVGLIPFVLCTLVADFIAAMLFFGGIANMF